MADQKIKVELYTLSTCPWSRNAKAWLHDKHVAFDYVDYDLADGGMQAHIQEEMLARGASAFPFVKFGDTDFIIGYNPEAFARLLGLAKDAATGAFGRWGRGLKLVGVGGFEPPTSRSRTERSTKLSHTPTRKRILAQAARRCYRRPRPARYPAAPRLQTATSPLSALDTSARQP